MATRGSRRAATGPCRRRTASPASRAASGALGGPAPAADQRRAIPATASPDTADSRTRSRRGHGYCQRDTFGEAGSGVPGRPRELRDGRRSVTGRLGVLDARRGGPAERFASRFGRPPSGRGVLRRAARRLRAAGARLDPARAARHRRARPRRRPRRRPTRASSSRPRRRPHAVPHRRVGGRLDVGGAPVLPILVGLVAIVCAFMRKWRIAAFAVFVLVVESATYRVTSLRRPARAPARAPARGSARRRELPVRATPPPRSPSTPGLVLLLTSRFTSRGCADRRLGRRGRCCRSSSRCRACTAACTIRSTWPAACSSASAPCSCCCSPAARPAPRARARARARRRSASARPRTRGGMKVAVVAHAEKTLGGGLPELRRVLEAEGRRGPALVRGAEGQEGARAGRARARRRAPSSSSPGAATAPCGAASACSPAPTPASPSSRPGRRTCSPPTSASRRTSSGRSRSACAASAATLDVGRFGERALRRDGRRRLRRRR